MATRASEERRLLADSGREIPLEGISDLRVTANSLHNVSSRLINCPVPVQDQFTLGCIPYKFIGSPQINIIIFFSKDSVKMFD